MADEYSLKAGQGNIVAKLFAKGCQGDVFQPLFAISMRFYRKRSAAFFRQQHCSSSTVCGDVRYEKRYLGVPCFDAVYFAYTLVSISPMLYVERTYGHWHPISFDSVSPVWGCHSSRDLLDASAEWSHLFLGLFFCFPHTSGLHFTYTSTHQEIDLDTTWRGISSGRACSSFISLQQR